MKDFPSPRRAPDVTATAALSGPIRTAWPLNLVLDESSHRSYKLIFSLH